jgi:MarR family transcriptional regulator, 2-MHQ and catechol-resistance regulon repressor
LVLAKAFRALATHAEESLNLSRIGLGDSDFRVLEVLLHKGPLPVNTIGAKVWLTPGSIV